MKKILSLVLVMLFIFLLTACGEKEETVDTKPTETVSQVEGEDETLETDKVVENEEDDSDAEWKQFIKEYNAWVDDYIAILKKYNENPTDMTILSDYTKMMSDLTEWSTKADKVTKELENSPAAAMEYAAELAKIAAKLANAIE